MVALWTLLLSAQDSIGGVPAQFVNEKKEELRQKHAVDERAINEAKRRAEGGQRLDEIRQRERAERASDRRDPGFASRDGGYSGRGRGGGGGGGRGDFGGGGGPRRESGWGNRGRGGGRGPESDRVHFLLVICSIGWLIGFNLIACFL